VTATPVTVTFTEANIPANGEVILRGITRTQTFSFATSTLIPSEFDHINDHHMNRIACRK